MKRVLSILLALLLLVCAVPTGALYANAEDTDVYLTLVFKANGGKGTLNSIDVTENQVCSLPKNTFTRKNYAFSGWTASRYSDGKWLAADNSWKTETELQNSGFQKRVFSDGETLVFGPSWKANRTVEDWQFDEIYFNASWAKACTSHKWDSGKVLKAATVYTPGEKLYTCTFCGQVKTEVIPALTPTWSKIKAANVLATNAQISATVKFSQNVKHQEGGFYFGTSNTALVKAAKHTTINKSRKATNLKIDLNDAGLVLNANTTYYYQFYLIADGVEFKSEVKSFATPDTAVYNFTLKFNANGGVGKMAAKSVKGDQTFTLPPCAFLKNGRDFDGWTVKRNSDGKWYVAGVGWKSASDITKNKWKKALYQDGCTITFGYDWKNGATPDDTFTFVAVWVECKHTWDAGIVTKTATTKETGSISYTCTRCGKTKTEKIPKVESFQFTFNANGGKGTMNAIKATKGSAFVLPQSGFVRNGYFFDGWVVKRGSDSKWLTTQNTWKTGNAMKKEGLSKLTLFAGVSYVFDESWINSSKNVDTFTFYAKWRACTHAWDAGRVTKAPTTKATGEIIYTCEICGVTKTEKLPKLQSYQFKFNANGGEGSMNAIKIEKGQSFVLPKNQFTKAGAFFSGWNVKRSSDSKWLTAQNAWKTGNAINNDGLTKLTFLENITYSFDESWINGSKNVDTYTFYAVWVSCEHVWDSGVVTKEPTTKATGVKTYTCWLCGSTKTESVPKRTLYQLKFAANGGNGTMPAQTVERDGSFVLPDSGFTKAGYTFVGWTVKRSSDKKWFTDENGWAGEKAVKNDGLTKTVFDSNAEFTMDADWINGTKNTDTYTFYAQWVQN